MTRDSRIGRDVAGRDALGPLKPPGPTRREALAGAAAELRAGGIEAPDLEAERMLASVSGLDRSELRLALGSRLSAGEARRLARAMSRRLTGVPLQHIEGTVEFRQLSLLADRRAFIPRPETERLVDLVESWAWARGARGGVRRVRRPGADPPIERALDVGTGSGAIALSLVHEGIAARVLAVDRSEEALEQAAENRERAGLTAEQVELRPSPGALWDAVKEGERFDLIVSNPPYVAAEEMGRLPPEVRQDPAEALYGGPDGLDVIRELASGVWRHLLPGGGLYLEIGETQGEQVRSLLAQAGDWARQAIERDLAGRVRYAFAERP